MFKKKDDKPTDPAAASPEFGDTGAPISDIDPDAIAARDESLEQELESARADAEQWKNKYLTALADFQNFQRRSVENEREARRQGVASVVSSLLGALDIFDLALKQDPKTASAESIMEGVTMIRAQLTSSLANVGVSPIDPKPGDPFDPHRHEAVAHIHAEGIEPGATAQTFQCGYTLGERVLRPAKVAVAKAPEPLA